jgi:hypothetical protein
MAKSSPEPFSELVKLAREHATTVSEQDRQSLPIPVMLGNRPGAAFLFMRALARPRQPVRLQPPFYLLVLRMDGSVAESRNVRPEEFGRSDAPREDIGTFGLPEGWTYETYLTKFGQLLNCLDILVPLFASGSTSLPAEKKAVAKECLSLETELMEPPLRAYYSHLGERFFSWLSRATY